MPATYSGITAKAVIGERFSGFRRRIHREVLYSRAPEFRCVRQEPKTLRNL
jgi:hypothetical protein